MSKKVNWAEVDIRIRGRKQNWSGDEAKALKASLDKLPDVADNAEPIEIPQPALTSGEEEEGEEEQAEES